MKLPKDLRKESKINPKNKKQQIYGIFKRTFIKLNESYEPHYSIKFLKIGETGKYSDLVYQRLGDYSDLDKKDFVIIIKEYENIELYVNWERLGKIFYKGKILYDLENHFEFYKNLFRQIAYHEYGHTYLLTSCSTMFYPNEAIKYLKNNNIKSINYLPEDKLVELNKILENSKQHRIDQNLKNINFMDIANGVVECHANYSMKNELKTKEPIEFLEFSKIDLLNGLHDYSKFNMNEINLEYINLRINNWVIKANDLFIYDKLHIMKSSCEKYGFTSLYNFANDLNCKYLEIVKNNTGLETMKDDILSLAEATNKINFKDAFFP